MDFAEIKELNNILLPAASVRGPRLANAQTEEELAHAFKIGSQVLHLSPKPCIFY